MTDYTGLATLVAAIGALVGSLTAAYVTILNTRRIVNTETMVTAIDYAVNGKPVGSPTISTQVDDLHDNMAGSAGEDDTGDA